jgi:large subunit ribosomal protein L15
MNLSELKPPKGAHRKPKRVGRGLGSGHGKTSCRGHKGLKARSGRKLRPGFEGGQMPLSRRIPKRGFVSKNKLEFEIINVKDLNRFENNSTITPQLLKEKGLIKNKKKELKVLGMGSLSKALTVKAHRFSKSAMEAIKKAGGKVEVL